MGEGDEITHVDGVSVLPQSLSPFPHTFPHTFPQTRLKSSFVTSLQIASPSYAALAFRGQPNDSRIRAESQVVSSEGSVSAERLIFGPANSLVTITVRCSAAGGNEVDIEVRRHMSADAWER